MKSIKFLSIVVPSYNQEKTILKNVSVLEKALKAIRIPFEIIIVIDGETDKTHIMLKKIKKRNIIIYSRKENIGKGYTVRYGMLKARGDVIGFIDAGFDINPNSISMLLNHMLWYNADIIVGSKIHPVSQVMYPRIRKIFSWGYRNYTHLLFGFKVKDTQVGIKLFKRKVVRDVFPRLLVKQFAFDVEILAVSYSRGFKRIYEAPVRLDFTGISTITTKNFWKIILHMLWDTMAVFYRLRVINYYNKVTVKNKSMHINPKPTGKYSQKRNRASIVKINTYKTKSEI